MPRIWTQEQQQAISTRGGTVLVSAAAGSGKTAVLTERVIQRITGPQAVDADQFLVVTFTRAAAAEMRSRIADRLRELIRQNPADLFLQRQLMLLQQAQICTIDSFFSSITRENFERLGISPNIRIMDDAMLSRLTSDTLSDLLEEQYAAGEAGFLQLADYFGVENDDALTKQILQLYDKLRALPYPFQWMEEQLERYRNPQPPLSTHWGQILLHQAEDCLYRAVSLLGRSMALAKQDPVLTEKYLPVLETEWTELQQRRESLSRLSWDDAVAAVQYTFGRLSPAKGCDLQLKQRASDLRKAAKEEMGRAVSLLCCTEAEYQADMQAQLPVIEALFTLTRTLWERLDKAKEEAGAADFADFAYYTLRLVADDQGNPTPFAREYAERYEEILLDEYQDTNRLQDLIFRCISQNGENLFLVGDLKQSIYRFRNATPAVFLEKKEQFSTWDGVEFPALIHLSSNFRSRKTVTDAVNYLFSRLMSRQVGDVAYDEAERLNCGATWYPPLPEGTHPVQLMLMDFPKGEGDGRLICEARAVAARIRKMLADGYLVTDQGALRPCRGGDFVILLRSSRDVDQIYAAALREQGVDAVLSAAEGYFSSREVSLMLSLLRVLDNPTLDIPMAAVLLSPVFGFSCDQLAQLALSYPDQSLYASLIRQQGAADPVLAAQAADFLRLFGQLREKAAMFSIQRLIQYIYDTTDFIEVMNRFSDTAQREANLKLLLKYAGDYAAGGNSELSGFVAYLDALADQNEDFEVATPLVEAEQAVRIMTIHRAKGLEFPIVVLANCAKHHNRRDLTDPVAVDEAAGFGMKRVERQELRSYPTLPYMAIRQRQAGDLLSEEMRLLYVALTRAKEGMILAVSSENLSKELEEAALLLEGDGTLPPASTSQASSYSDWLLPALLDHPALAHLQEKLGLSLPVPADAFPLEVVFFSENENGEEEKGEEDSPAEPDPEMAALLRERFDWVYPHLEDTLTPAKTAVTRIVHEQHTRLSMPDFTTAGGYTPAQQGSIFHRALQFADFARGAFDPAAELQRLVEGQWLTQEEAKTIRMDEFEAFFQSPLMGQMLRARRLLREYKFFDTLPAEEAGFAGEGEVLIQGIADCVMLEENRAVVVDFKTDRVTRLEQLTDRYQDQLHLYQRALSRVFPELPVSAVIYSTCLKQSVEV